jgi:hypothetical protein
MFSDLCVDAKQGAERVVKAYMKLCEASRKLNNKRLYNYKYPRPSYVSLTLPPAWF